MYLNEHQLGASKRSLLVVYETARKNAPRLEVRAPHALSSDPNNTLAHHACLIIFMIGAADTFHFSEKVCTGVLFHSQ
eukprot:2199740-Pleurochrysis_carterae.AAC.1